MGKYGRLIKRAVNSVDYWAQVAMRRFVADIDRRMSDQNVSRVALAEKLGTSPAYVTKVMRGDVNFTLETMTKLALAVNGRLQIQVVDSDVLERRPGLIGWQFARRQVSAAGQTSRLEMDEGYIAANQSHYQRVEQAA